MCSWIYVKVKTAFESAAVTVYIKALYHNKKGTVLQRRCCPACCHAFIDSRIMNAISSPAYSISQSCYCKNTVQLS